MKRPSDTVKCPMLGMTIKMSRCNLTSKQELDFWGPNAAQFNRGCPCNKREATIMAKRNCEGCGRTVYGKRWCNNCRPDGKEKGEEGKETMAPKKKVEKAGLLTTEEFCKQVDEAAAKYPDLPKNGDSDGLLSDAKKTVADVKSPSKPIPIPAPEPRVTLVLKFYNNDDLDILDFIGKEAKRCRRTPDQQVLWMLQSHMPAMNGREAA